ncbi:hypothetical protein LTR39_001529, partial [Cryomyces antarcticus]
MSFQRGISSPRRPSPINEPFTPKQGDGAGIDEIILSLAEDYDLSLQPFGHANSPFTRKNTREERIKSVIKLLYWKDWPALEKILRNFREYASSERHQNTRTEYLLELLEDAEWIFKNRVTTSPLSARALSSLQGVVEKASTPSIECLNTDVPVNPARCSTPTQEDPEFLTPPQSPTPNHAAARKHENLQSVTSKVTPPKVADDKVFCKPALPRKKRRSSGESTEWTSKPKRVSSDKSVGKLRQESPTYVPGPASLPLNRSFGSDASTIPSPNTSFNLSTGVASTTFTSFTSDATDGDPSRIDGQIFHSSGSSDTAYQDLMNMLESDRRTNVLPSNVSTSLDTLMKSDEQVLMVANEQYFPCDADDLLNAQLLMELGRAAVSAEGLGVTVRNAPEQHQVKRLPEDGLFIEDMPSDVKRLPFGLQFECVRVAQACQASLEDLCTPQQPYEIKDYQKQWTDFEKSWPDTKLPQQVPSNIWASAGSNYENVSLKGSLEFNRSNNGPLFRLALEPFRREKSCRFQRAFGGDRFLYLDVPSFRDLPKHLKGQQDNLLIRYREWLGTEKRFLVRTWRVLLVSPKKAKKKNRGKNTSARQPEIAHAQQLVLFATGGSDLTIAVGTSFQSRASCSYRRTATSIEKVINRFMPVKENSLQPYCKAYARLELGFSKTVPALVFMPSQVRHVPDTITDGSPESTEFDDPRLKSEASPEEQRIMNDGCSRISVGAAKKMWCDNSLDGPVPSAFQGRIGGAKGVWMISAPSETTDLEHTSIWIEITPSQTKFKPHDTDLDDATFDSNRLTFEMLKFSGPPKTSILHMSFLSILQDRGIPKDTLIKFVRDHLDHDRKEVLAGIEGPVALRRWLHSQNAWLEESQREQGITWQAALPRLIMEKVNMLLESGFDPKTCTCLAERAHALIAFYLASVRNTLSLRIGRSTYVLGVADPKGCLKPGEVHMSFSTGFHDDRSGKFYNVLQGREILIARHPTVRRSDIQKVRAVFKEELSHLIDVVVFPTTGNFPLAGKLQGGDYDGDTFWLCWEPDLTSSFKNAPPPYNPLPPEYFGIKVDRTTLGEVASGPSLQTFLTKSFDFRCRPELLGQVTIFHEKLSYAENSIDSPGINALADLHDHLVDSSKNGYIFDHEAWQ